MFVYKSRFFTRGEVWFDDEPGHAQVDWVYHRQRSQPLPGSKSREFYTRLIDLQKSPEELFAGLEEKTATKITEASEKDRLRCERCDTQDGGLLDQVEEMWNRFATAQKAPMFERRWIEGFVQAGVLDLVNARDAAGTVLAYHLVLMAPRRARQLFAISPYTAVPDIARRNTVSRANCFIHWHNFLTFREQGIRHFDFGGWYRGTSDMRMLGINAFKKSFGGQVVREYDCEQPVTLKGWILLRMGQMLAGARSDYARSHAGAQTKTDADNKTNKISPAFR